MDKLQACKETKELWIEMARFAREENQFVVKSEIEGPWQSYCHNCPCCEYVKYADCSFCPMLEEWKFYSNREDAPCEAFPSPYKHWRELWKCTSILCIDVEFFCLLIAEMAEEAIERHIAESQPALVEDKDIEYT